MSRTRSMLGLIAGFMLVASSAAHSLVGWPQLRAALAQTRAPEDLVLGLAFGWHFAGAAMLTFGCIVLSLCVSAMRRRVVSYVPAFIIALLYLVYGAWAYAASGRNPFFFVYIVPGVLLAAASWPSSRSHATPIIA
jgi:hypothetical protein